MKKLAGLGPELIDLGDQGRHCLVILHPVLLARPDHDGPGPDQRHPEAPLVGFLLHGGDQLMWIIIYFFNNLKK